MPAWRFRPAVGGFFGRVGHRAVRIVVGGGCRVRVDSNRLICRIANTSPLRGPSVSRVTSVSASRQVWMRRCSSRCGCARRRRGRRCRRWRPCARSGCRTRPRPGREQRRGPAAAVEPDQHAAVIADHVAQLGDQPAQLGGQRGGRFGHYHQQRVPGGIGHPSANSTRHPLVPGQFGRRLISAPHSLQNLAVALNSAPCARHSRRRHVASTPLT
jgi:hypothetical protein